MDRGRFPAGGSGTNQARLAIPAATCRRCVDMSEVRRKIGGSVYVLLEMRDPQTLTLFIMPEAPPPFPVIEQPKPKFTWYQYAWIGWPLILIVLGGAIGGGLGGAAAAINYKLFQKTQHPVLRYVWTG